MFCSVSLQRTRVEGSYQVCQIISTSQGGRTGREKGGEMSLHQLGFFTWLALFDVKNITARSDLGSGTLGCGSLHQISGVLTIR